MISSLVSGVDVACGIDGVCGGDDFGGESGVALANSCGAGSAETGSTEVGGAEAGGPATDGAAFSGIWSAWAMTDFACSIRVEGNVSEK